jgi:hypothetical protein
MVSWHSIGNHVGVRAHTHCFLVRSIVSIFNKGKILLFLELSSFEKRHLSFNSLLEIIHQSS